MSGVVEISGAGAAAESAPTTQHTPVNTPGVELDEKKSIDKKVAQENKEEEGKARVRFTMLGRLDKGVKAKKDGSEVL